MEPIEFERDELTTLPAHDLVTFAKREPRYRPLPAVLLLDPPGTLAEGRVICRWTFTDEERQLVAAGKDLYVEVLTFGQRLQPILPTVGLRDFCPMTS